MNLFEKIYNHQILSMLDRRDSLLISSQERSWLKRMLDHPGATDAFAAHTFEKLQTILADEQPMNTAGLTEKARMSDEGLFHPLLRPMNNIIRQSQGITVHFRQLPGSTRPPQTGIPYQLEFSLAKRLWYLLWMPDNHRVLFRTKLESIEAASSVPVAAERVAETRARIRTLINKQKQQARIDIVPAFNGELTRILYAFSCFEREVNYDPEQDIYSVMITFDRQESEYLLARLRFLGKRIRVSGHPYLQQRMLESATLALARYGL